MQSNSITPAPKAQPQQPFFIGFDNIGGKNYAKFEVNGAKVEIAYANLKSFVTATNAVNVPAWALGGAA